jgi:uncharacterized lipoprotein
MKNTAIKHAALVLAIGSTMVLGACSVEQTEEGNMPEVEVTEEGNLPAYDVETADVSVGTQEAEVTVPDVDVNSRETSVTVPDVDVTMPDEQNDDAQNDAQN